MLQQFTFKETLNPVRIDLCGHWDYRSSSSPIIEGTGFVPGCIHADLIKHQRIPDPYYRDVESQLFWISESDWLYEKNFSAGNSLLSCSVCELVCEGLDTLATVSLNGEVLGYANNMYRRWVFDVKPHLIEGVNTLQIQFQAATPWLRAHKESTKVSLQKVGAYEALPRAILRKEPCNFGWDWGPVLTTCGIWMPIYLQGYNDTRLENVRVEQLHDQDTVSLKVSPEFSGGTRPHITTRVALYRHDVLVAESTGSGTHTIAVTAPELWWPAGMGKADLYELRVERLTENGKILDSLHRRIGLRTIRLVRNDDASGQSFYFEVNGKAIFAKGANWIPADSFPNNTSPAKIRQLLEDARSVHMNMIRVWGGGYYEPDVFYDICDELGLMVWQDFMYCCSTYPTDDADFMSNIGEETREQICRLRHHASLALWCGNNELEMYHTGEQWDNMHMPWDEYDALFSQLLPQIVKELHPGCAYWPGSPHSPQGDRLNYNNPDCGDAHIWDVWFHDKDSDFHLQCNHRFISEFGFASFAHPTTIKSFTLPEDRILGSYILGQHQRNRKGDGVILNHIFKRFKLPTSFEDIVWLSQITQGDIMREAIEHWRRLQPRTMGVIYWQLNDCWPATSWSTLDYAGRWKASHYMTRRYFAPQLLSVKPLPAEDAFEVWLSQDLAQLHWGELNLKLWHVDGRLLQNRKQPIPPLTSLSRSVARFENEDLLTEANPRDVLIELVFNDMAGSHTSAIHHFVPLKYVNLEDPKINLGIKAINTHGQIEITLAAKAPALFAFIDHPYNELRASDNFCHLFPDQAQVLQVSCSNSEDIESIGQNLTLSHIFKLCNCVRHE
jgi:beta-mannosidase